MVKFSYVCSLSLDSLVSVHNETWHAYASRITFSELAGDDDRDLGGDEPGHLAGAGPQAASGDHELRHGQVLAGKMKHCFLVNFIYVDIHFSD